MAYVPPHRRKKAPTSTAVLLETQAAPSASVGTTTNQRTRWEEKSTAHQPPRAPRDNDNLQKDMDDDVNLVCTVLTRICCINLQKRPEKWQRILHQAQHIHERFANKVERFEAIQVDKDHEDDLIIMDSEEKQILVKREWDATKNAQYSSRVLKTADGNNMIKRMTSGEVGCALSHVQLWQQLKNSSGGGGCSEDSSTITHKTAASTMLILEDDVVFTCKRGKSRFARAFAKAWKMLPSDQWSILYLGFSSRGERIYVNEETTLDDVQEQKQQSSGYCKKSSSSSTRPKNPLDPEILLYRPTYGFHTHAYVINTTGAAKLLENLPVVGPIDVWLADNEWFGLSGVYCAVIAHEGWRNSDTDGTYEGTNLISQDRKTHSSDIQQSSLQKAS